MTFKKLALAVAIAAVPVAGFSVETLEDADLGGVTGQDGIQIDINIGAAGISTTQIYVHDTDGLNGAYAGVPASYSYDGAIVISGMNIGVGGAAIGLRIDAGDNAISAGAPVLNIGVSLPATLTINTGALSVANSEIDELGRGINAQTGAILNSMEIELGSTFLNIQLGNEEQTGAIAGSDMIVMNAVVTGGVTINGFALNDINSGGAIGASSINISNAGASADLNIAVDADVTAAGLAIEVGTLGTGGMDIEIVDFYLGTSTDVIGDISILGLNLTGTTVVISGK